MHPSAAPGGPGARDDLVIGCVELRHSPDSQKGLDGVGGGSATQKLRTGQPGSRLHGRTAMRRGPTATEATGWASEMHMASILPGAAAMAASLSIAPRMRVKAERGVFLNRVPPPVEAVRDLDEPQLEARSSLITVCVVGRHSAVRVWGVGCCEGQEPI